MKKVLCAFVLFFACSFQEAVFLEVSPENARKIGDRIWQNECGGLVEGLTSWKKGENFPSLGIGHFIWYCRDKKERFQETFPALLAFLQRKGTSVPGWLKEAKGCPWNSREEFYADIQSPKMKSLRQFLFDTRGLQAVFIAQRLEESLPEVLEKCTQAEKNRIEALVSRLTQDANGLYALIDYVNFKGKGISPTETYNGQGWGLLQVLREMLSASATSEKPLLEFVRAAKAVLKKRVENSPPERNEAQWLKGWFARLDTYIN